MDPRAATLPRALQAAGYATAHIGKWHLGGGRDVTDAPKFAEYGFDTGIGTYESPEPHPDITATNWIWSPQDKVKRWDRTAFFVSQTLEFLASHAGQPCFVNLWLDDPHTPWVPDDMAPKGDIRSNLKRVMEENDRQLGRLMDALPENTLLIFASDNGPLPTFGDARTLGLRGCKLSLYEGGIRLPLIVRWPRQVPAGRVDASSVIAAVDMFPTLCRIGGAALPKAYASDGIDVSPAFVGKPCIRTKPLFWEYGRNDQSFKYPGESSRSPNVAMLDGDWKLLINTDSSDGELYDLFADPNETTNVAAAHVERTAMMMASALEWRASLPRRTSK
ncbi:MAG: hypothetical protein B7Z55_16575 [Planctomycetales bacterium 12-60-4]|nr:MAG: hypothetical protein B7Z55_16575 [Planctomycetales bacterium 12-60-4]